MADPAPPPGVKVVDDNPPAPPGVKVDGSFHQSSEPAPPAPAKGRTWGQTADAVTDLAFKGLTLGYGDDIDRMVAKALGMSDPDKKVSEEKKNRESFQSDNPKAAFGAEVAGGLMTPGVGLAGKAIANTGKLGRLAGSVGMGATLGGIQGSGEAGAGHRLEGAEEGAKWGAILGPLAHAAGGAIGGAARGVDTLSGHRISGLLGKLGDGLSGAEKAALNRLRPAVMDDKMTPKSVAAEQAERKEALLPKGATQEVSGENTRAVARVAARKLGDDAREQAVKFARQKRGGLPDLAADRLDRMSDYKGTVEQRIAEIEKERSTEAANKYQVPYSTPVHVDDKLHDLLSSTEAKRALGSAEKVADEWVNREQGKKQAQEIRGLRDYFAKTDKYESDLEEWGKHQGLDENKLPGPIKSMLAQAKTDAARERILAPFRNDSSVVIPKPIKPEPPAISGGALDRVLIAMRRRATQLGRAGVGDMSAAIHDRATELDKHISDLPHMKEAREAYAEKSNRMEAMEILGTNKNNILTAKPENFKAAIETLSDKGREDLKIAVRDHLKSAVQGRPGEAIAGLDRIENGTYARQNLEALFGKRDADSIMKAAEIMSQDLKRAQFVAGAGSPTAMNQEDKEAVAALGHHLSPGGAIRNIASYLYRQGYSMSKQEASAIVKFSQGDPHELLDLLKLHPHSGFAMALTSVIAKQKAGSAAEESTSPSAQVSPLKTGESVTDPDTGQTAPETNEHGAKFYGWGTDDASGKKYPMYGGRVSEHR